MATPYFIRNYYSKLVIMNYTVRVEVVDEAALLLALGYELRDYSIITSIDLNGEVAQKREKTANYEFSDNSSGCNEYGTAEEVLEGYKMPVKGQSIKTLLERAKLAAHNYQVLKSVILKGEPLQYLEGKGYYMLKNANGVTIPSDDTAEGESSEDLASIAIAAAMGCKVISYRLEAGRLTVTMAANKDNLTVSRIEQEKNKEDNESDYSHLSVLVAAFMNREELIKGIYARQEIMLIRGSKQAIFSANADEKLKKRILLELNR